MMRVKFNVRYASGAVVSGTPSAKTVRVLLSVFKLAVPALPTLSGPGPAEEAQGSATALLRLARVASRASI